MGSSSEGGSDAASDRSEETTDDERATLIAAETLAAYGADTGPDQRCFQVLVRRSTEGNQVS